MKVNIEEYDRIHLFGWLRMKGITSLFRIEIYFDLNKYAVTPYTEQPEVYGSSKNIGENQVLAERKF